MLHEDSRERDIGLARPRIGLLGTLEMIARHLKFNTSWTFQWVCETFPIYTLLYRVFH